jgi:integrase
MAKLSIEYGKTKKDGSRSVMIRLVSGKTQKHIPTHVNLEKKDYREYSDGRIKILNDEKFFEVEDMMFDLKKKVNQVLRDSYGIQLPVDEIVRRAMRPSVSEVRKSDFFEYADKWLESTDIRAKHNYRTTLNSLARFIGERSLTFAQINVDLLTRWCKSLSKTKRAQSLYLTCFKHIYRLASLEFNTDDNMALSPYLFQRFKIPQGQVGKVGSLSVEQIRQFFEYKPKTKTMQMAQDCCMLSFCLMGTNLVDLYSATRYDGSIFAYERTKTKDRRSDRAYIEIDVHEKIKPLFAKYKSRSGKQVFVFADHYANYNIFVRTICVAMQKMKVALGWDSLTFYQFRHSIASIARNKLRYPKSDIDELLNHVGGNRIADIYIEKDFSVINEINRKVIEFVFRQ